MTGSRRWIMCCLIIVCLLLSACQSAGKPQREAWMQGEIWEDFLEESEVFDGTFEGIFAESVFKESKEVIPGVILSLGSANEGYLGIRALCEKQIVIQLIHEETKYNFFVPVDGSTSFLPLSMGEGVYTIRILENAVESKYVELLSETIEVNLESEFAPYLHASLIVSYDENSKCVQKAAQLAEEAVSELDFVRKVYAFIAENISYDENLAETVAEGYIPLPDRTLETGKGICFDISSLTAAMLRSQGIPTKVITGYVGEDALYHAWNSFYIPEQGWVSVEIRSSHEAWSRLDLTFAVTGASINERYVDRYIY